jgi:hypothetical protein
VALIDLHSLRNSCLDLVYLLDKEFKTQIKQNQVEFRAYLADSLRLPVLMSKQLNNQVDYLEAEEALSKLLVS